MTTLVVTVAWAGRRRDLAVPADVPIANLLWPLALAVAFPESAQPPGAFGPVPPAGRGTAHPSGAAGQGAVFGAARPGPSGPDLTLAPLGGGPLPGDRTLGACGIGDGAVLVVIAWRPPAAWSGRSP